MTFSRGWLVVYVVRFDRKMESGLFRLSDFPSQGIHKRKEEEEEEEEDAVFRRRRRRRRRRRKRRKKKQAKSARREKKKTVSEIFCAEKKLFLSPPFLLTQICVVLHSVIVSMDE